MPGILTATLLIAASCQAGADDAISVRLRHPDRQLKEVLALFQNARARHPAALLASWRRATRNPDVLDKVTQAVIASFNPEMVKEWSLLHEAKISWNAPDRWSISIPDDDGTFAAFATALALTDGAAEPPLEGSLARVDRLGRPGAPLSAQIQNRVVIAATRADLQTGLQALVFASAPEAAIPSGFALAICPNRLPPSKHQEVDLVRRIAVAMGIQRLDATLALQAGVLNCELRTAVKHPTTARIDAEWLSFIPAEPAFAATTAIDDGGSTLDALARAVEIVWPDSIHFSVEQNAKLKSSLQTELRGITTWAVADRRELQGVTIVLHTRDGDSAARVAATLATILAPSIDPPQDAAPLETPPRDAPFLIGRLHDRPIHMLSSGDHVLISWGRSDLAAAATRRNAGVSPLLKEIEAARDAHQLVIAWPGRIPLPGVTGVVHQALAGTPPVIYHGRQEGPSWIGRITWTGARQFVARLCDLLPSEPDPNAAPQP